MTEYRPWLSDEHNQIAQLLDILEAISDDMSINVGYPSDLLSEWKKEHPETVAHIERMNLVGNWSHDHYSHLWTNDPRTMMEMDKDASLREGETVKDRAGLEALADAIMEQTRLLEETMKREKVSWNDHWEDPRTKPITDLRDRMMVTFAQSSRLIDLERHRAMAKK